MALANPAIAWHREHIYFARLLDLLQGEIELMRRGREAHCEVMIEVVEYLQAYGERYHHPREDAAFERLAARRADLAGTLERLREEHALLALAGEKLLSFLNEIVDGVTVAPDEYQSLAICYVLFYREHLAVEEADVLPAAESSLRAEDWDAIERAVPTPFDPLLGARPEQRYHELLDALRI